MNKDMVDPKEIKDMLMTQLNNYATKDELKEAMKHDILPTEEPSDDQILEHLKNCTNPECKIKQYKDSIEDEAFLEGMVLNEIL